MLVSGASGLIGVALLDRLRGRGHEVHALVRSVPARAGDVLWDAEGDRFDAAAAEGAEAVVHLAGENIAAGRWTTERKRRILDSRAVGTSFLAKSLLRLSQRPRVVVSASAVGYYGDAGDRLLDESSPSGGGFLAGVCREWEAAAAPLAAAGVRVVHPRIGVVLSARGGALAQMLPVFRVGLGGRLGSGEQWMSWITLDDLLTIVERALDDEELRGPVNAVAPEPVTNAAFTRTFGRVLGRPTVLPAPAFALRLVLGEMAEELLLASTRVDGRVLRERGHEFAYGRLEPALRSLCGGSA